MDEIFNDLNSIEDITEDSDNVLDTEEISDLEYKEIIGEEAPILDGESIIPDVEEEIREKIYKKTRKKQKKKKKKKSGGNEALTTDPSEEEDFEYKDLTHAKSSLEEEPSIYAGREKQPSKKDIILQKYNEAFLDPYEKNPEYKVQHQTKEKKPEADIDTTEAPIRDDIKQEVLSNSKEDILSANGNAQGIKTSAVSNRDEERSSTNSEPYEIDSVTELAEHIKEVPLQKVKGLNTYSEEDTFNQKKSEPANGNKCIFQMPGSFAMELFKNPGKKYQDYGYTHDQKKPIEHEKVSESREKVKERNDKEEKEESFSRKFKIKGEGSQFTSHLSDAGRSLTAALLLSSDDPESIDYEQRENAYYISSVAKDVFDSLGNMGLKASAKMAKDYSYKLERGTAKANRLIAEGVISKDELGSASKNKVFRKELEQRGISKKDARYISSHRKEIKDAIEAKIILSEFSGKMEDTPNVFAKTKVMGKNVILLSKKENDRQKALLKEENTGFFDPYKKGALNKNMIKTYFSYHEDDLFKKMNPERMSKKDLRKFIKKIETGKIKVKEEYKEKVLPLLRSYDKAKRMRENKRLDNKGFFRTLSKRGIERGIDYFKYSDDLVLEGVRNYSMGINNVIGAISFTKLSFYAAGKFYKLNKKINPAFIAVRAAYGKVVKPVGKAVLNKTKKAVLNTGAGKAAVDVKKKAGLIKKRGKQVLKKTYSYKAVSAGKGVALRAGMTVNKIKHSRAVTRTSKAVRKVKKIGRGAAHIAGIPFMPVRAVKKTVGKVYKLFYKAAIAAFVVIFCLTASLILLLFAAAAIQSVVAGQGTLFQSTILDEKIPERITRLKNKDTEKYQKVIDIATSPPQHDADHIDSKGLYPDEAYFGVKLYHYGSPETKDSADANIYHNYIEGSETKNGYHIYFLDSNGNTIGNSTTNIKDVLCLSAVMSDNYYDDKHTDKIDSLQDEIFNILNPEPIYTVSELYNKEGSDKFPYDTYTYEQKTYYCNDADVYTSADLAKQQGVMFYKDLSPKTSKGCSVDEEKYDEDFDNWLDEMPSISDYLPSWSDYVPDIDDYTDSEGNVDYDSYNSAYEAAEAKYDEDYDKGLEDYDSAKEAWQGNKPDINSDEYKYCPGHPVPGKDNNEEDPISVSYGYRDINIYVTILTKDDVYKAFKDGGGIIKYKVPSNYECTAFEDREITFEVSSSFEEMLSEFNRNDGWKSKKNKEWCDELYNNDWEDIYGTDVYSDSTVIPSGKGALSDQQIKEIIENIGDVSEVRQAFVNYALSYVGQISYYWGGKPDCPGWEGNNFGSIVSEDYKGRNRKGLDCSGFISWCYWSVTGIKPSGMSTSSLVNGLHLSQISYSDIKPGDIGFISKPGAKSNHVGIFVGIDENTGRAKWVHCAGEPRNVVVCDTTNKFSYYYRLFD